MTRKELFVTPRQPDFFRIPSMQSSASPTPARMRGSRPSSGQRRLRMRLASAVSLAMVAVAPCAFAQNVTKPIEVVATVALAARDVAASGESAERKPVDPATAARARSLVEDGIRYENAEGVEKDFARAHALYCAAARLEHADAFLRMGWMYANGRGVAHDDAIAGTLFRRAAALGSEAGERLSRLIRSDRDEVPECLREPVRATGQAPADAQRQDTGPTPTVDQPAVFDAPRLSPDRQSLVRAVLAMARDYRLDPRLVLAIVRAESNFDPLARSPRQAQGLMQLIPETAERFAVRNVLDPLDNLRGGMAYLRWLLSYFRGDVVLALAGYNAGEGAVDRHRGVPPYAETLAYVQRVRALYPNDWHPYDKRVAAASAWTRGRAETAQESAPMTLTR